MTFAEKIFTLRKQAGYSQEELAEKLDVSRQAVSRWESGVAIPDAANLLQLSRLFGVTVDYLINDEFDSDEDIPTVKSKQADVQKEREKLPAVLRAVWMGTALALVLSVVLYAIHDTLPILLVPILTLPFPVFYFQAFHRKQTSMKLLLCTESAVLAAVNVLLIAGYFISLHLRYDKSYTEFVLWGFFDGGQWVDTICSLNAAALTSLGSYLTFATRAKRWWALLLGYAGTSVLSASVMLIYAAIASTAPDTVIIPIAALAVGILLCLLGCMAHLLQEKKGNARETM